MPSVRDRWHATLALALALGASLTGLFNGFALDDVAIVLQNDHVHQLLPPWRYFAESYWPPPHGAGLYRPLTILGFALQWRIAGAVPLVFHLINILLYLAVAAAVYSLARRVLSDAAAFVAAALFAVHPVHVEAVGNVVGQSEIVVGLILVLAIQWYLRLREAGPLRAGQVSGFLLFYLVALGFKEHALVLPALLVLAELLFVPHREPLAPRLRAMLPLLGGLAIVLVAFWTARTLVLEGLTAHDLHPAFRDGRFLTRLYTTLGIVPIWARLMLFPAHLSADYNPQYVPVLTTFAGSAVLGAVIVIVALALVVWSWRRHPPVAFGIVWFAVAVFPVSNLLVPTGVLLAERTLFLPSVGICLALGYVAEKGIGRCRSQLTRGVALGVLTGVVLLGLVRSALRQPVWRDNETLFAQMVIDAPGNYRAPLGHAGVLFARGQNDEAEREYRRGLDLYGFKPEQFSDLGDYYVRTGRYEEALDMYRRALAIDSTHWPSTSRSIYALIQLDRLEEAERLARAATERGDPGAKEKLVYVDSLLARRERAGSGKR